MDDTFVNCAVSIKVIAVATMQKCLCIGHYIRMAGLALGAVDLMRDNAKAGLDFRSSPSYSTICASD
jgi:hypothetical protein